MTDEQKAEARRVAAREAAAAAAAAAAEKLLSHCTVKLLAKVQQCPRSDDPKWLTNYYGKHEIKERGEVVGLSWGQGKHALVCLCVKPLTLEG